MDIYRFIQILLRKGVYLIVLPLVAGLGMYLLTRNMPHEYSSKASVFSGVTSNTSLDNLGNTSVDYFANKTAYNNLLSIIGSKKVMKETSLRLLTQHLMLDEPDDTIISTESYRKLQKIVPDDIKNLVDKSDAEATYQRLASYVSNDKGNFLYGILNYDLPYYSYKSLSKIEARQEGSSDIIEIIYKSGDPGITYQTIRILIRVFLREYGGLQRNQSDAVVEYFQQQLDVTTQKLSTSEDHLLDFNTSNRIINFYEQTKYISSQQEKIEIELQDVVMQYEASKAVLRKLEEETKNRYHVNLTNKEILVLRDSLVSINKRMAEIEIIENDSLLTSNSGRKAIIQRRDLEKRMKDKMNELYLYQSNTEGIALKELLNNWLKAVIDYESVSARLTAMQTRKVEFDHMYAQYAPLGAELKRIERKINVTEEEYLEILHHLGLAKLKQQSQEMMANMKILDEPYFPIDPEPTKHKVFVVLVSLFTLIFLITGILIFELFDKTIKNKENLLKHSGLETLGAIPFERSGNTIDMQTIQTSGLKPVIEKILSLRNNDKESRNMVIQFLSHWQGEGKTHAIELIKKQLTNLGYTVAVLTFGNDTKTLSENEISLKTALNANNYADLTADLTADFILVEVPALSKSIFNQSLFKTAHFSFMVSNAQCIWSDADDFMNKNVQSLINNNFMCILNRTALYNMENMIGEIPGKCSGIKQCIKYLIPKGLI